MSTFAPSGVPSQSSGSATGSTTPLIYNLPISTADTEVTYSLPAGTKQFLVRNRNSGTLKLAFTVGESATNYLTIYPGAGHRESSVTLSTGLTLYLQTTLANQIIEILSWS